MKVYVRKTCSRCHGSGEIDCQYCGGDGYNLYGGQCSHCCGMGWENCPDCDGDGYNEELEDED